MLNNKLNRVNEYIENIKEWQWLIVTFIICMIAIISISVEILWEPYIHAEDGRVFIQDAIAYGKSSLFHTWAGYLAVLPRLFAIIAVHFGRKYNSMVLVATIVKSCAIIFSVIVANYLNSKEFKFIIKNRILRLMMSILLIFTIANHEGMLYNGVTIHWWGGILSFLVGLNFINKKMPPLYIIPFLILAILSSPSALIVGVAIIYYLFTKRNIIKNKKDIKRVISNNKMKIFKLLLIGIAATIEISVMLFGSEKKLQRASYSSEKSNSTITRLLVEAVNSTCQTIPHIFTFRKLKNIFTRRVKFIIGIIVLAILLWRYIKNKNVRVFVWGILSIMIIYIMGLFRCYGNLELPNYDFYTVIQSTVGVLLVIKCLYDDLCKSNKIVKCISILFFIGIILIFKKNAYKPQYKFCDNIFSIEEKVDFSSQKTVEVEISPSKSWHIIVPVRK